MDKISDSLIGKIQGKTGIIITEALQPAIHEFINRRMKELNLSAESYSTRLEDDDTEMELLVNASTVNETYFFRDEAHYEFLQNNFFPSRSMSTVHIWCGACSTGEEPLSIHALAKQMGIETEITATDINTEVLAFFKKGIYSKKSFRTDGQKYHRYIRCISTETDGTIKINPEEIRKFYISFLNLNRETPLPFVMDSFDLIILRNVFIYFSSDLIMKILGQLWPVLKVDGILLLTTNEIAAVPENAYFEKKRDGDIYYLQKKKHIRERSIASKEDKEDMHSTDLRKIFTEKKSIEKDFLSELKFNSSKAEMTSYKDILKYIDRENYRKAEDLLSKIDFSSSNLEYMYLFTGIIKYQVEDYHEAEINFYKSSSLNQKFWPASIMLAFTYKHIGKLQKALVSFEQSLNILMEYVKNEKSCYNFTIDFDPVYIINICKKNMDEIRRIIGE